MLRPDAVRTELVAKLAELRELWHELHVPDYVTETFWTELERDLATDLSSTRPRQALQWTLGRVERYRKLQALDAPAIILRHEAAVLHEVGHHLGRLSASRRWGEVDVNLLRQYFEPEPTRSARVGSWTVRYPQYGEIDESDATSVIPTHEVPLGPVLAGHGRSRSTTPHAHALPFVCGRITHLLGTPPEHARAGFALVAEDARARDLTPIYVEGDADTLQMFTRGAAPIDVAPIVAWLFADHTVADIDVVAGRSRFGVRDGQPFAETLPPDVLVPGWLQPDD